jgi:hypothetical protein
LKRSSSTENKEERKIYMTSESHFCTERKGNETISQNIW